MVFPSFGYTGITSNLNRRLHQHNHCENRSTARYALFNLTFSSAFPSKQRALAFEAYLKSGSGHAFILHRKRVKVIYFAQQLPASMDHWLDPLIAESGGNLDTGFK